MKRALLLLWLLARTAHAERPMLLPEPEPEAPSTSMLSLHLEVGREPVPGGRRTVFTDGLELSGGLPAGFRIAGEAALAYAFSDTDAAMDTRGVGAYGSVALRHHLASKWICYVDAEAGVGGLVLHDSRLGRLERPDAFVGLRAGYDAPGTHHRTFEGNFDVRLVATPDGLGWLFGVAMGWGG